MLSCRPWLYRALEYQPTNQTAQWHQVDWCWKSRIVSNQWSGPSGPVGPLASEHIFDFPPALSCYFEAWRLPGVMRHSRCPSPRFSRRCFSLGHVDGRRCCSGGCPSCMPATGEAPWLRLASNIHAFQANRWRIRKAVPVHRCIFPWWQWWRHSLPSLPRYLTWSFRRWHLPWDKQRPPAWIHRSMRWDRASSQQPDSPRRECRQALCTSLRPPKPPGSCNHVPEKWSSCQSKDMLGALDRILSLSIDWFSCPPGISTNEDKERKSQSLKYLKVKQDSGRGHSGNQYPTRDILQYRWGCLWRSASGAWPLDQEPPACLLAVRASASPKARQIKLRSGKHV